MIYFKLFYEFFMIGLFSIGGGLATLPFLSELGQRTGWYSALDLSNMIAISESTPGPIGINMATYAGFTSTGILGGLVASLSLIIPSIIIILIISKILNKFKENHTIQSAFYGLRPASTALILVASIEIFKISFLNVTNFSVTLSKAYLILNWKAILFGVILFFLMKKFKLHPAFYIVISALIGIIVKF